MEGGGTSQLPAAQLRAIFRGPGHRTGNLEVDGEGGDSKPPRPSCGSVQNDCGPPPSLPTPGSIRYLKGPPVLPLPVWTPQPARPHPIEQQPPATPWPREGLQYLEHNYTKKLLFIQNLNLTGCPVFAKLVTLYRGSARRGMGGSRNKNFYHPPTHPPF